MPTPSVNSRSIGAFFTISCTFDLVFFIFIFYFIYSSLQVSLASAFLVVIVLWSVLYPKAKQDNDNCCYRFINFYSITGTYFKPPVLIICDCRSLISKFITFAVNFVEGLYFQHEMIRENMKQQAMYFYFYFLKTMNLLTLFFQCMVLI